MPRIIVITQDFSNEGDTESPNWMSDGQSEFLVANITPNEAQMSRGEIYQRFIEPKLSCIEVQQATVMARMIDWNVLHEGMLTQAEAQQMRMHHSITRPPVPL